MRVIVSGDVLDAPEIKPWQIHELLGFACSGRHIVVFDSPAALDRCLDTFGSRARDEYEHVMGLNARAAARLPADVATVRVEATSSPRWEDPEAVLPLADALEVLRERLGILVENAANDWSFLLGIMRASDRDRMRRAIDQDWAVPLHGGGSTLDEQLRKRLSVHRKALRTFVLFDSDRLHPDELEATWTPDRPGHRPAACKAFEWEKLTSDVLPNRYWRLRRRFIESYMPRAELSIGASRTVHPDAVAAFYRMGQDQRWYFNMKKGFAGDANRHDKDRQRDLYDTVGPGDRHALDQGFGDKLADHYAEATTREFDWDDEALREASAIIPRLMRLI